MLLQISEPGQSANPHQHKLAVGIDLGTTHSLVASVRNGVPECLPDSQGRTTTPSVVSYTKNNIIVGENALNHPEPFTSIKRWMGRSIEEFDAIQPPFSRDQSATHLTFKTKQANKSPVEISSDILKALKFRAEETLGDALTGVVVTVPAYFDDAQRQATKDAAALAGLNVLRLINEPTAAAIAYGLDDEADKTIAVYDLGGGTFDISILQLSKGIFEVIATGGDTQLGGDDIDTALMQLIAEMHQQDISLMQARSIKEALTTSTENTISNLTITRETLNQAAQPLIEKTLRITKRTLKDAALTAADIDDVILVGGSTRTLAVIEAVNAFFDRTPLCTINPDEAVALGAAIQANKLVGNDPDGALLLDVNPLSLGLETMGGLVEKIIHRNTTLPVARAQQFTTFKDGQTAMKIHVLQGERETVEANRSLAKFELRGIPPMVAGQARIQVTFQVDADGLLTVSAMETTTGTQTEVSVKPSYGLETEHIESMLRDSMDSAETDKHLRTLRETQTEAKRIMEAIDSALSKDAESLLSTQEHQHILSARNALESTLNSENNDQIKAAMKALEQTSEFYVERRMNQSIQSAIGGKHVDDIKPQTPSENSDA